MKGDFVTPHVVEAWGMVLPFLTGLSADSELNVRDFLKTSVPQINHARFEAAVALLEAQHGVKLYHRAKNRHQRSRVTSEGARLVTAWQVIRGAAGAARPRVRAAAFGFAMTTFLGHALAEYLREGDQSGADVTVKEYTDLRGALEALTLGRVECVFGVKTQADQTSHYENVSEFREVPHGFSPVLIYPASADTPPDPRRLDRETLVVPRVMPSEWAPLVRKRHHRAERRRVTVDSFAEVLTLVRQGVGCGLLPGVYRGCLSDPALAASVAYLPWPGAKAVPFGVFVPRGDEGHLEPAAAAFVDGVMQRLGQPEYFVPPDNNG
jgi:DNA-binding transcriptional LysR family regulator